MKKRKYRPPFPTASAIFLLLTLVTAIFGFILTLASRHQIRLPYADVQLAAAKQMALVESEILRYIREHNIPMEKDDLNQTGMIGPEWTELTSSLGLLEAKRTSLQPDFAALMVKYYMQAGLTAGATVCCGMSGSFPGLCIAAVCAANQMGLRVQIIASYGASMYGATRVELPVVRMLDVARQAGLLEYELLAVSPGNDYDQGNSLLYPDSRKKIFELAREDGLFMIDEPDIAASIRRRLELFGPRVDCFVNVGGASANMGTSPYTLTFPNGLVIDPPKIPLDNDRGLTFEYAARGIPVIHLLNVRKLAEDNGLPFDPVPLTQAGETDVYNSFGYSSVFAFVALIVSSIFLLIASKFQKRK